MSYSSEVLADSPSVYGRLGADTAVYSSAAASTTVGGETASKAFDGIIGSSNCWTSNGVSTGWLRAQLASAAVLTAYKIARRDDIPGRNPTAWTFEGSNDASSWTTLDTRSGITWPTAGEIKSFTFSNSTAYLYYRLNITANNGDTYLSIAELILPFISDASGNARYGMLTGTVTTNQTGLLTSDSDTCVSFSSGQGFYLYDSTWLSAATFSAEALFRFTGVSGTQTVMSRYDTGAGFAGSRWSLRADGSALTLYTFNGSSFTTLAVSTIAANTTYHVVLTYDGTTAKVYVNGSLAASAARTVNTYATPFWIGASNSSEYAGGKIDEVAYYSGTALSSTRVSAHYAAATSASASVTAPAATATASAAVPMVTAGSSSTPSAATATAAAVAPTLSADGTVSPPAATATAAAVAPVVGGNNDANILPPAATAIAAAVPPSVSAEAVVVASIAAATADAVAPAVIGSGDTLVLAALAAASAAVLAPVVSASATVAAVPAAASAAAVAPVWTQIFPVSTDVSNTQGGRDRRAYATVTVAAPVAAGPAGSAVAEAYDVAVAYPTPTMVDGRPT